jgi:hypothetical protein
MNVDFAVARLKAQLPAGLVGVVEKVTTVDDAVDKLKSNKPCAFVMFTGEGGGEAQGGSGATTQKITYRFMVLLGAAGAGFAQLTKGGALEETRDAIKDALMGFMPAGAASPIVLVSCRPMLRDEDARLLFLNSEFQTTYYIRKQEST